MALSTASFWDSYYENLNHVEGMEWYVDDVIIMEEIAKYWKLHSSSLSCLFPSVLHVGCGVGSLAPLLDTNHEIQASHVIHIDIAPQALSILQKTKFNEVESMLHKEKHNEKVEEEREFESSSNLLIQGKHLSLIACSVYTLPIVSHSIDLVVGKGTFDSISMASEQREERVFQYLTEIARVLKKGGKDVDADYDHKGGLYFIFSLFEPCGEEKDMLGLLSHPSFTVTSYPLLHTPYELPHQPFLFLYVLTRNHEEN